MPKIDTSREAEIKRAIRRELALDPLLSSRRLSSRLAADGFHRNDGSDLDHEYILKLIRKINSEAVYRIHNDQIDERMIAVRERFTAIFERLFKIAFWRWEYMQEGIFMPEPKDQIKAMENIMKYDIALVEAEMDAGIYKRNLGTLEIERRNAPLTPERKAAIELAMKNWGFLPDKKPDALSEPTTQSAAAGGTS